MKILLPYSTNLGKKFNHPITTGGIEKFCHQINDTFDDVEILEINDIKDFKKNTKLIKDTALKCGADIIICNWIQASFAGMKIMDSQVPILVVCHENSSMLSTLNKFYKLQENGHSVALVSEYQKIQYDKMAKRTNAKLVDFDFYINSSYVTGEKPKLVESIYDCCTIGRCDPRDKKPFLMKTMLKDTKIKNLLMTNIPNYKLDPICYPYYRKNKHWEDTLWDLNYDEVMNNLSKSKTFFQTWWNEAFGITSLESLSRGVPVIANSKNNFHASNSIASKSSHYKNITFGSKEELIDAINSFKNIDRKEIQDMTWEKHAHIKWKKHFENCVDKTIEKFKSKR